MANTRRSVNAEARELGLIKDNVSRIDDFLGEGVVAPESLEAIRKPEVDALHGVRLEGLALVLADMDEATAAEDLELCEVRLEASESFMRCHAI